MTGTENETGSAQQDAVALARRVVSGESCGDVGLATALIVLAERLAAVEALCAEQERAWNAGRVPIMYAAQVRAALRGTS